MDSTDKKIWYSIAAVALLGIFASEKLAFVTSERQLGSSTSVKTSYIVYKNGDDEGVKRFAMFDSVNDSCTKNTPPGMHGLCVRMGTNVIERNPHMVLRESIQTR